MNWGWLNMPKINTRITFNKPAAVALIKAASNASLTDMGNQALEDIKQHVPKDQGTLQGSGISSSDKKAIEGKFVMRWSTPYAQYLWNGDVMYGSPTSRTYGPEKLTFTSALAREEWAKYAREVYGEDWKKVYQASMKRSVQNGTFN